LQARSASDQKIRWKKPPRFSDICACAKRRGETVCNVNFRQSREVVEGTIVRHRLEHVLTPEIIERITARVVELAQADRGDDAVPVAQLEEELATQRTEQRRRIKLLARIDDAEVEG
jgi:hypothetical protein